MATCYYIIKKGSVMAVKGTIDVRKMVYISINFKGSWGRIW